MRKLPLIVLFGLLVPFSASATLIGDSVSGCFSDSGCSPGVAGSFSSSGATVSEGTIEFSGSESGFDITADFLTFGGQDVIRIEFNDSANTDPSLPAGWELRFFGLNGVGGGVTVTSAHIDTSYQVSVIEDDLAEDLFFCFGAPSCIEVALEIEALRKASVVPATLSVTTTVDSMALIFDEVISPVGNLNMGAPWFDIVLETQVVPEPSTATLLGLGLVALAGQRRLQSESARRPTSGCS